MPSHPFFPQPSQSRRWRLLITAVVFHVGIHTAVALGEEKTRIAVLPPVPTNKDAESRPALDELASRLHAEFSLYPQIDVVPPNEVRDALRAVGFSPEQFHGEKAKDLATRLRCTRILFPTLALYPKSGLTSAEILNLWIVDGSTGQVIAAADEESDRLPKASSVVYGLEAERFERMIAAAVASIAAPPKPATQLVAVMPFDETGEDSYGRALGAMVATRWMRQTQSRHILSPFPWSKERPAGDSAVKFLADRGVKQVLQGRILTPEGGIRTLEFSLRNTETGKPFRVHRIPLASDADLRSVASDVPFHLGTGADRVIWMRNAKAVTGPILSGDRLVYGTSHPKTECVAAMSGEPIWEHVPPGVPPTPPKHIATTEATILAQCANGILMTLGAESGKLVKSVSRSPAPARPFGNLLITPAGSIVFVEDAGVSVFALDAGAPVDPPKWFAAREGFSGGIGAGVGLVGAGNDDFHFYALDAETGVVRWRLLADERVRSTPLFDGDRVLFGTDGGVLLALDARTGRKAWTAQFDDSVVAAPVALPDAVIAGDCGGNLACIEKETGKPKWKTHIDGALLTGPILANSVLICTTAAGHVYAVTPASGEKRLLFSAAEPITAPPAIGKTEALMTGSSFAIADDVEQFSHILFITTASGRVAALGIHAP